MCCEYIDLLDIYNKPLLIQKGKFFSMLKINGYQMETTSMHKEYAACITWKI